MRGMLALIACLLPLLAGCSDKAKTGTSGANPAAAPKEIPPEQKLWVVLKNKTGADMWHFDLDVAGEHVNYQIFSDNYTFSEMLHLKNAGPVKAVYQTKREGGEQKQADTERTIEPRFNGGKLKLTFLPGGKVETQMVLFRGKDWSKTPSTPENTVPAARKLYDALELGMGPEDVELITGSKPSANAPSWSLTKGIGQLGKKGTVTLKVSMVNGKVVRVSMSFSNDPEKKDSFIAEKGKPSGGSKK